MLVVLFAAWKPAWVGSEAEGWLVSAEMTFDAAYLKLVMLDVWRAIFEKGSGRGSQNKGSCCSDPRTFQM